MRCDKVVEHLIGRVILKDWLIRLHTWLGYLLALAVHKDSLAHKRIQRILLYFLFYFRGGHFLKLLW
jgi:hypothetical protein